jgi:lysophospholipase L1-like esterase
MSTTHSHEVASPRRARSVVSLMLASFALVAVTCARSARLDPGPGAESAAVPASEEATDGSPVNASQSVGDAGPAASPEVAGGPLERFHRALADLKSGARAEAVRIVWLGDSHTAADFYPDELRRELGERFGEGGPGFVYAGLGVYRHSRIQYERQGAWDIEPRSPSARTTSGDGVFGLGGVRAVPRTTASSLRFRLRHADAAAERITWEIHYRLPKATSRLAVVVGGERRNLQGASPGGRIERVRFETSGRGDVVIRDGVGQPELFGVVVESLAAGVVVDTLGINGARVETPLAWDEEAWVEELRHRDPSLIVLAYGSNEVGDRLAPSRYGEKYSALLERVRRAAPEVACVVLGLPDQATTDWRTPDRVPEIDTVQRQSADAQGCTFVGALAIMGGPGGFRAWLDREPSWASSDRIHLTPRGYAELGRAVAHALLPSP